MLGYLRLPTPTRSAVNIAFAQAADLIGSEVADSVRSVSLDLYRRGAAHASERGIIVADTKFEFGMLHDALVVADELLTPDSSRFWAARSWRPGAAPPSFDKQHIRDYLDGLSWDKNPPPPPLPDTVVNATTARYVQVYERITGLRFIDWPGS